MTRCSFCNITKKRECGRTFHRFPINNPCVLKQWLQNYPFKNWGPSRWSVLCSDHFTEECFDRTVFKVRLHPNSVPTRFDNPQSYCIYCKRKRTQRSGYSFFKFPLGNSFLLQKWLDNMKMKNWTPNNSSLLCSQHFEQTCFRKLKGNYLTLRDGSVPTIFEVESFNNMKSDVSTSKSTEILPCKTEFSENTSFNDNDPLEPDNSQLTFDIEFKDEIPTYPTDQSISNISMNENMFIREKSFSVNDETNDKSVDKSSTLHKTANINFVDHDHYYAASPLALRRKLVQSQEIIKTKKNIIKLQQRQLQRLKTRIIGLKKTIIELSQFIVSRN